MDDEDNTVAVDKDFKLSAMQTEELVEQRRAALDDKENYPVLGKVKPGTPLKENHFVIRGMGGKHSYLDGSEKIWNIDGKEHGAGNGLFHLPKSMLPSLCDTLAKCKWHMVPVIKDQPFNFVADFDDKKGEHIGSLGADTLKATLERSIRKFFAVSDLEVVIMPRNDQCGYHAWTNVVVDQCEGWIALCKATIADWQKQLADEDVEVGLGAGKELDYDIYQTDGVSLRPPYVFKHHSSTDTSSAYIPIGYEEPTRTNMRKFIGFPADGASITPLTEDGKAASTTVDNDNDPHLTNAITERMNSYLGDLLKDDLPVGLVHFVKERGEYENKPFVRLCNNMGLCYSAAAKGELYMHSDGMNEAALQLYKLSVKGMCFGQHGNVPLTREDNESKDLKAVKVLCGLYGDAARDRLLSGDEAAMDDDEIKLTTRMKMARKSISIINSIAGQRNYRKENGMVLMPNPKSLHDYVQIGDGMDYNDFITECMQQNSELNNYLHCDLNLKSSLCNFLDKNDDPEFPILRRQRNAIACRDGVLFVDDESGPNMHFVPTADVEEGLVARVFIDEEYSVAARYKRELDAINARYERELDAMNTRHEQELELAGNDTDIQATQQAEIQALKDKQQAEIQELDNKYADGNNLCELSVDKLLNDFIPHIRQTFKDQKFDTNEQQFAVPGRQPQVWPVEKLLLAMCGRLQYPTGKWDEYAFMLWLWGQSRTGKSFCTNVQKEYFSSVGNVTSSMETTFGKAPLAHVQLVAMPDIKKPVGKDFPLDESAVQLLIEGGRTDIARKNRDPLQNYKIDAPVVADANKKPGQIWQDEMSAIINRVAIVPYLYKPAHRNMRLLKIVKDEWELLPLLVLQVKLYQQLRAHAGETSFVDWNIPLFMDERAKVEMQNNHMLRFLTAARGEMGTKDLDIWCEHQEDAKTAVRDLRTRFDNWMRFDQHTEYNWNDINLEEALRQAGVEHECEFVLDQPTHYYKCMKCGKDVESGERTTLGACCREFKDNPAPVSLKAKRTKIKVKDKSSAATIKNLALRQEPKHGGAAAAVSDLSNWAWNGQCGCGQPVNKRKSQAGVEYYSCYFGPCDDARCSLKYRAVSDAPPIAASGGSKWP
eukprot:COSAG03_NODE_859_length_5598_cov_2.096563_2_plen_1108_part_00